MKRPPLNVAPIGMGGFAMRHHAALRALEDEGLCRVVAACDPHPGEFAGFQREFALAERGIAVYADYRAMLEAHRHELDFATVPTPIGLHLPMHRACVDLGIACYLEKPPTLDWAELTRMLAAEQRARKATMAGFVHAVEEPRRRLKQRLLSGEFGPLRRVGLFGLSPRDTAYYARAPWAGRLMLEGDLILDSCIGNALAHFVHNLLFWCGPGQVLNWEGVAELEAELYRAHDIENFDTCFARGRTAGGIGVHVAASHAGTREEVYEWLECERAVITWESGVTVKYEIAWRDGRRETANLPQVDLLLENLRHYISYLQGETARPLITLADSRPFVHFNGLLYAAAGAIHTIPAEYISRHPAPGGGFNADADYLEAALASFREGGRFPGEGTAPWGRPGGAAAAGDIDGLRASVKALLCHSSPALSA